MTSKPAIPTTTVVSPRLCLAIGLLLAGAILVPPASASGGTGDAVRQTLEQARTAGSRSVTVHVQGSSIALLVTAIEGGYVIGRSAQHERIVVRIDRIDAVAF